MFLPKIGAISAFLTTLWIEMMMIDICMVTITLQLCVIIKMKTKSLFFFVFLFLCISASVGYCVMSDDCEKMQKQSFITSLINMTPDQFSNQ